MLIDTCITVAYKCPSCGSFEFFSRSLFELTSKGHIYCTCGCKRSRISIAKDSDKTFRAGTLCIGCGNRHIYILDKNQLLYGDIQTFKCPVKGIKLFFAGKDNLVRETVDKLEQELDSLIDTFGYDSYFLNTQVMYNSLNKIHDIAAKGNLFCECGENDIELILQPDRILLVCRKCSGSKTIFARTNGDLKDIMRRQQMLLSTGYPGRETGNTEL